MGAAAFARRADAGHVPAFGAHRGWGATIPTLVMPGWVQTASQALPTFWATEGLAAMTWRGLEFQRALLPSAVLILCFAIGHKSFR